MINGTGGQARARRRAWRRDGRQGHRRRRRQHVHARARRGVRPSLDRAAGRRARAARHRRRAARDRRRAGRADARQAGLARPARPDRDPRRGARRRRLRAHPAAGRRAGGPARRRDAAAHGSGRSARRPPGPAVSPRRCAPCRSSWSSPRRRPGARRPGAWIVDFTNPVGIVTQALLDEGHRAIGLCNVAIGFQRGFAERFGVEPERVELEHVGLNHLTWEPGGPRRRRRPPARALEPTRERDRRQVRRAGASSSGRCARSRPTTCATTTPFATVLARAARAGTPGARRSSTSSASCSRCTATRRSHESRSCSTTAAAPSTARPPRS